MGRRARTKKSKRKDTKGRRARAAGGRNRKAEGPSEEIFVGMAKQ